MLFDGKFKDFILKGENIKNTRHVRALERPTGQDILFVWPVVSFSCRGILYCSESTLPASLLGVYYTLGTPLSYPGPNYIV